MTTSAITIRDVGKLYALGDGQRYRTLRETLTSAVCSSARFLGNARGRRRETAEQIWALKDVSVTVHPGEAVGVIGRNGAGKSTLLKILSRITEPTEGFVSIRGRVASLLEVGTGFHPELTGRENIFLCAAVLGMSRAEIKRKFDRIVAFAEVSQFIDTPVKHYSSGMYVRLAFAVAAHLEPEILLVDEVLAVGDAGFQKKCLGKMGKVATNGRTVLFVSHNMAAVTQLCRRAIWLERGQLRQDGDAQSTVAAYLSDGSMHEAERTWQWPGDAPGDDRVRLLRAHVQQHGAVAPVVDINQPSQVEMEFCVLRDVENLVSGINVYSAEGICLFGNCDWRPNRFPAGCYRKHVELPAQLLAEGNVNVLVQLIFYEPNIPSAVVPDALSFECIDSAHSHSVRGPYKGRWPGVTRIGLRWSEVENANWSS